MHLSGKVSPFTMASLSLLFLSSFVSIASGSALSISGYLQLVSFAGTNYCETISNVVNYGFNSAGICYPISSFPIVALPTAPQSVKVSSINPLGSAVSVQGYSDLSCKTAQVNNSFVFLDTSQGICPQGGVLQTPVPKYFIYVGSSVPASPLSTYLNVNAYPFQKCNTTAALNYQVATSSCVALSKLTGKCYTSGNSQLQISGVVYPVTFTNTTQILFNCVTGAAATSSATSSSSCFAGSETVMLASGETRAMAEIQVGDEIAVASMDGAFAGYSPVIAIPHAANSIKATFAQITTVSGRDIKMTPDHLVLGGACASPSLVQAGYLKAGECVQTVSGAEIIASVTTIAAEGIYTVVTKHNFLLIVNGIVASPFAVNHLVANSFYNIVRFVYGVMPSMAETSIIGQVISAFGKVVTSVFA